MTEGAAPLNPGDDWDPIHFSEPQQLHWTTDNVGEAIPGVMTPLNWSVWKPVGDGMSRETARRIGAFTRSELTPPSEEERIVQAFYGRIAIQVEYMATIGDRLPGTSGPDAVAGLLGKVPEAITFAPTRRRYPAIAMRLPYAFATSPGRIGRLAARTDAWWREQVPRFGELDLDRSIRTFTEGRERFDEAMHTHVIGLFSTVTPLYEALTKLVDRAGVGDVGLLSGTGGAEMAIVEDIWAAARGRIEPEQVIRNHGFHGPREGELSSRVWREDPEPLLRMIAEYAARDESEDPAARERERNAMADAMRREVIAAVPRSQRASTRLLLRLAARRLPIRGVGKRAFLQAFDVARGSARRAGEELAAAGALEQPDDVFYLTDVELTGGLPPDAKDLVARRRERRAEYELLTIPGSWRGIPAPEPVGAGDGSADGARADLVEGLGVSSGVVDGVVRVVTDPGFADVEPDEILVSPTTDPSWSSIMFVSSALIVDIGGPLSHAAVVARELGIPCVVNTRSGSRALRTGDRVRVDGSKGTVEVLERAGS